MEELSLVRVRETDIPFLQYLPGNFRPLLGQKETVCVGVIYQGMACGAALAEENEPGEYYLRYIYVDPKARLCGLGTYLLRGLLGELEQADAWEVKAMYSPSMLESGHQTLGILERAGFSAPKPVATAFSVRLGDIRCPAGTLPKEIAVYTMAELPEKLREEYRRLVRDELPDFVDSDAVRCYSEAFSSVCVVNGELAGVLCIAQQENAICVAGLYVRASFRKGYTAAALISKSVREGMKVLPPETEIFTSAINRDSFSLCDKLFRRSNTTNKETEFLAVYQF